MLAEDRVRRIKDHAKQSEVLQILPQVLSMGATKSLKTFKASKLEKVAEAPEIVIYNSEKPFAKALTNLSIAKRSGFGSPAKVRPRGIRKLS